MCRVQGCPLLSIMVGAMEGSRNKEEVRVGNGGVKRDSKDQLGTEEKALNPDPGLSYPSLLQTLCSNQEEQEEEGDPNLSILIYPNYYPAPISCLLLGLHSLIYSTQHGLIQMSLIHLFPLCN